MYFYNYIVCKRLKSENAMLRAALGDVRQSLGDYGGKMTNVWKRSKDSREMCYRKD
jgi:hypothetical protein